MEDHILLWEILSDMKLTHLAVDFCILRPEAANKEKLICLLQKCSTVKGIECRYRRSYCYGCGKSDTLMLSYFTSLHYCHLTSTTATLSLDIMNDCKELKCVRVTAFNLSLNVAQNHNLQQLYIKALFTDVPDHFMTSVSAHGGLVHVVMDVQSLTTECIISLVRNSPKLITLYLRIRHVSVNNFNVTLKQMFSKRKLFTAGYCSVNDEKDIS